MIYTYQLKRKCLHCGKPIPDQAHLSRKFCGRLVISDGSIESCRDDFWAKAKRKSDAPYKRIATHHKVMHNRIEYLFGNKEEVTTLEQLNKYGIKLTAPVEFSNDGKGNFTFYFVEFAIIRKADETYKIIKHDRVF